MNFDHQINRLKERHYIETLGTGSQQACSQMLNEYQDKVFGTCISFVLNKEDVEVIAFRQMTNKKRRLEL